MLRQIIAFFLVIGTFHYAYSQNGKARLFKPSISVSYTYVPEKKLSDSVGNFSNQIARVGFFIPIWNHYNAGDSAHKSTYFQVIASANNAVSFPQLRGILANQTLLNSSLGVSGVYVRNRKNIFTISLHTLTGDDEKTIAHPEIRYAGIALYRRNVSRNFSFTTGLAYSYFVGRGILFPVLGATFKAGKKVRVIINLPTRISVVALLNRKFLMTAYLKPNGGFNFISNQSIYTKIPSEINFRQRETRVGMSAVWRAPQNFHISGDIGLSCRRTITLSDGLGKSATKYYKTGIDNGAYFTIGIKYIFRSVRKDKEDEIIDTDKAKDELLNDPDFYNIVTE